MTMNNGRIKIMSIKEVILYGEQATVELTGEKGEVILIGEKGEVELD